MMGQMSLHRSWVSFVELISPERLPLRQRTAAFVSISNPIMAETGLAGKHK
jgi:hypothetical protein